MDRQHIPRPTRHPWTETEDRLLYFWMERKKSNLGHHLSSRAIANEMTKEVAYLRSVNYPSLPEHERNYSDDAIKNRIDKITKNNFHFHPLRPRNPHSLITGNEVNQSARPNTNISSAVPRARQSIQEDGEYAASFQEPTMFAPQPRPITPAYPWLTGLPTPQYPGVSFPQVSQDGSPVRQPVEDIQNPCPNQQEFISSGTMEDRKQSDPENTSGFSEDVDQDTLPPSSTGVSPQEIDNDNFDEGRVDEYDAWIEFEPIRDYLGYPRSMVIPNLYFYSTTAQVSQANRVRPEMISIAETLRRAKVNHELDGILEKDGCGAPPEEPSPWREYPQN